MPTLGDKHANVEMVAFSNFTGGLNLVQPPESIGEDEMQEAMNFEFAPDTGLLRMRGGIMPVRAFSLPVTDIIPVANSVENQLLVRSGSNIYRVTLREGGSSIDNLGYVDGDKPASYELWGDDEGLVMCFGSYLYLYDGAKLKAVTTERAPTKAEILTTRVGRVVVAETGSDTIRYSGVGDATRWTEDSDIDSVSLSIGYKDGRNIKAFAGIAGELIVFKCPDGQPEWGRIYRLQGEYPGWNVVPYSHGSSAWNHQSVAAVSSDILFLTREGLANLGTVTEYGDFKLGWAGAKVNPRLALGLTGKCSLKHLPMRSQVWVLPGGSDMIWCHHYEIGKNACTTLRFPGRVRAVASSHSETYLGIGNVLYRMNENITTDNGEPITASLKPRTLMRQNQILVKGVLARFQSTLTSDVTLKIDKFKLPLLYGGQKEGHRVATDTHVAFLDEEPLVPADDAAMTRERCNIRRWEITPKIEVRNGMFSLSSLVLKIVEV